MIDDMKIPLISLQDMAYTPAIGGEGVHDLSKRNEAFGGKLIWQMYDNLTLHGGKLCKKNIWITMSHLGYSPSLIPQRDPLFGIS